MLSYSHQNIDKSDIEVVSTALKQDFLTGGKKVEEFENALCEYVGVKYACVVNSATSALHLAYSVLNCSYHSNDFRSNSKCSFDGGCKGRIYRH